MDTFVELAEGSLPAGRQASLRPGKNHRDSAQDDKILVGGFPGYGEKSISRRDGRVDGLDACAVRGTRLWVYLRLK